MTQSTIGRTICVPGYTERIRPPESITEAEKWASLIAYGDPGSLSNYEYDHIVSLELGGAVNDPRNLWPEPGGSPNPKDGVEDALHAAVCDGRMTLAAARLIIARHWVAYARRTQPSATASQTATTSPPSAGSGVPSNPADVNCSNFATHAAAQAWFDAHGGSPANDVAGLDANHDGVACSSLP